MPMIRRPRGSSPRGRRTGWPPQCGGLRSRGALSTDRAVCGLVIELRAVLHEEAVRTGELVLLCRENDDVELEVRQVGTRQLEARRLVGNALLERLDRLAVVLGLAGGVVIGGHA